MSTFNDAFADYSNYNYLFESDSIRLISLIGSRSHDACHAFSRKYTERRNESAEISHETAGRPLTLRGLGVARETRMRAQNGVEGTFIKPPRCSVFPTSTLPGVRVACFQFIRNKLLNFTRIFYCDQGW